MTEQQTPGIDVPRAEHARRLPIAGIIGGLALAILAKLVAPAVPFYRGGSLADINGACSGVVGMFIKSFGGKGAEHSCAVAHDITLGLNLAAVAGLVLAAWSGYVLYRRTHRATS